MSAGSQATTARIDEGAQAQASPDGLFETLKNARRRAVLRYLLHEEETADFRDLVQYVAALENETTPDGVSAAQRNRVRTALYQHHLGKLEEHGFIEYDKRAGTVSLNGNAKHVEPYIEPTGATESNTAWYLFGLAILATGIIIAWVPTLSTISALAVGGLGFLLVVYTYETEGAGRRFH